MAKKKSRPNPTPQPAPVVTIQRPISPEIWGRDHISTLLYIECRVVDHVGKVDRRNLRVDATRHPAFAHAADGGAHPTRLAADMTVSEHDDVDCIEDLVAAGLVVWNGTGLHPIFGLTDAGWIAASMCRRARAEAAAHTEITGEKRSSIEAARLGIIEAMKAHRGGAS